MISVILNVYNGERYIERCVDSVLSQTYQDFELIIVDDGSTDSTARIIDRYPPIYKQMKVYHTENKGLSGSRRYGLSKATGDYLIFLDCDDWVEKNWLEELYSSIITENADMAICEYYEEYGNHRQLVTIANHTDIDGYVRDLIHGRTWCVVWNKLVKTEIVKRHGINFFEHLRYWEDVPFSISYSLYCDKVAFVHKPLYHYIKTNNESLTAIEKNQISFNLCRIKAVNMIEEHLQKTGKQKIYAKDLLWIKYWIKDQFILHTMTKERIELWRKSFPEVNNDWKLLIGKFSLKYWALEHGWDCFLMLNGKYWELRHKMKALLKNGK